MGQFKKGYVPMSSGITFLKSICLKTQDERTSMSMMTMIPYASVIGSILHTMLCTIPNVSYALRIMNKYELDQSEGH